MSFRPRNSVLSRFARPILCGVAVLASVPLSAQTNVWTGSSTGDWSVPGNWSLGVPGKDQTVVIEEAVVTLNGTGSTGSILVGRNGARGSGVEVVGGSLSTTGNMSFANQPSGTGMIQNTGSGFSASNSNISAGTFFNIGTYIDFTIGEGEIDTDLNLSKGTFETSDDLFIGGSIISESSDATVTGDHTINFNGVSNFSVGDNIVLGQYTNSSGVTIDDTFDFDIIGISNFNIDNNFTVLSSETTSDETIQANLLWDVTGSIIDVGENLIVGSLSNNPEGQTFFTTTANFTESVLDIGDRLTFGESNSSFFPGTSMVRTDVTFDDSYVTAEDLNIGVMNIPLICVTESSVTLRDTFVELDVANSSVDFDGVPLEVGRDSEIVFIANGPTRATDSNLTATDLYSSIDIINSNIKDADKGAVSDPVNIEGIIRFIYEGDPADLNTNVDFELIRTLDNNGNIIPNFKGFFVEGLPDNFSVQPLTNISKGAGVQSSFELSVVNSQDLVWNGSASNEWENPTNWTPNQVPTINADATINNDGFVVIDSNNEFVGNLEIGSLEKSGGLSVESGSVLSVNESLRVGSPDTDSIASSGGVGGNVVGSFYIDNSNSSINNDLLLSSPNAFDSGDARIASDVEFLDGELFVGRDLILSSPVANDGTPVNLHAITDFYNDSNLLNVVGSLLAVSGFFDGDGEVIAESDISILSTMEAIFQNDVNLLSMITDGDSRKSGYVSFETDQSLIISGGNFTFGEFGAFNNSSISAVGIFDLVQTFLTVQEKSTFGLLGNNGSNNELTNANLDSLFFESFFRTGSLEAGTLETGAAGSVYNKIRLRDSFVEVNPSPVSNSSGSFILGDNNHLQMNIDGTTRLSENEFMVVKDATNDKGDSSSGFYSAIDIYSDETGTPGTVELDGILEIDFNAPRDLNENDVFSLITQYNNVPISGDFDFVGGEIDENDLGFETEISSTTGLGDSSFIVRIVSSDELFFDSPMADFLTSGSYAENIAPEQPDQVVITNGGTATLSNDAKVRSIKIATDEDVSDGTLIVENAKLTVAESVSLDSREEDRKKGNDSPSVPVKTATMELSNSDLFVGGNLALSGDVDQSTSGDSEITNSYQHEGGSITTLGDLTVSEYFHFNSGEGGNTTVNSSMVLRNLDFININRNFEVSNSNIDADRNVELDDTLIVENVDKIRVGEDMELGDVTNESQDGRKVETNANILFRDTMINVDGYVTVANGSVEESGPSIQNINAAFENVYMDVDDNFEIARLEGEFGTSENLSSATVRFSDSVLRAANMAIAENLDLASGSLHGELTLERSYLKIDPGFESQNEQGRFELFDGSHLTMTIDGFDRASEDNVEYNLMMAKGGIHTSSIYSAIDVNDPNDGFSAPPDPVLLGGTLEIVFGPNNQFEERDNFEIITVQNGVEISGNFDNFIFSGLPPELSAVYQIIQNGDGNAAVEVEIIGGDFNFVGNDLDSWLEPDSWDLMSVPNSNNKVFVNNGERALYDTNSTSLTARELNIGTEGNSGGLVLDDVFEDRVMQIGTNLNIGVNEQSSGFANGTFDPGERGDFPLLFGPADSTSAIRIGVTATDGNATGEVSDEDLNFFGNFAGGYDLIEIGKSTGMGDAIGLLNIPVSFIGFLNDYEIGVASGSGFAQGTVASIEARINGELRLGVSEGDGSASGEFITQELLNVNTDSIQVGVAEQSGDATGYLEVTQNNTNISKLDVGVSDGDGNAEGTFVADVINGSVSIGLRGNADIGVSTDTGSAVGRVSLPLDGNVPFGQFFDMRIGVSLGSGSAEGYVSAPVGLLVTDDLSIGLDGVMKGGGTTVIGELTADRGLTTADELFLGTGSRIINGASGSFRGFVNRGGYHAFDVRRASLGGELILNLTYPVDGDETFQIIKSNLADGIIGNFDEVNVLNLPTGVTFTTEIVQDGGVEVFNIVLSGSPQNPTWTNPSTGLLAGSWFDPNNWSTSAIPTSGDLATIDNGGQAFAGLTNKGAMSIDAEVLSLDVGINGGDGSMLFNGVDFTMGHSLNVGYHTEGFFSGSTEGTAVFVGSDLIYNGGPLANTPLDLFSEFKGINVALNRGAGSVTGEMYLNDANIIGDEFADQALRVGTVEIESSTPFTSGTFGYNDALVGRNKGLLSNSITLDRIEIGHADAFSGAGSPGSGIVLVEARFADTEINLNNDLSFVDANTIFSSADENIQIDGNLLLNNIIFNSEQGVLKLISAATDDGTSSTLNAVAEINSSTINTGMDIARSITSRDPGTVSNPDMSITLNQSQINTVLGDIRVGEYGASAGGENLPVLNLTMNEIDATVDEFSLLSFASGDMGTNLDTNSMIDLINSDITANKFTIVNGFEAEDGDLSTDELINITGTNINASGEFGIAQNIASTGPGIFTDASLFVETYIEEGSSISADNIHISAGSDRPLFSNNGSSDGFIDTYVRNSDMHANNVFSIGEMLLFDTADADFSYTFELRESTLFAENGIFAGTINGDSAENSQLYVALDLLNASMMTNGDFETADQQGTVTTMPDVDLNLSRSYLKADSLRLNPGTDLSLVINGTTRIDADDFILKGTDVPSASYPGIDVTQNASLRGTLEIRNPGQFEVPGKCETVSFLIIDADTITGVFDDTIFPVDGEWSVRYDTENGDVYVDVTGGDTVSLQYAAGTGGTLTGTATQNVPCGASGNPVTALPEPGFTFSQWSDGVTDNPRTDMNVTDDISVTAEFIQQPVSVTLNISPLVPQNSDFDVTAIFGEEITGLDAADVSVVNGTATSVEQSMDNANVWFIAISPTAEGTVEIQLPADVVMAVDDSAPNEESNTLFITYDITPPTVQLTTNASEPVTGSFEVTATFSENVSAIDLNDIQVINGTPSNIIQDSQTVTRFTVTPSADPVSIQILGAGVVDIATNNLIDSAILELEFEGMTEDYWIID